MTLLTDYFQTIAQPVFYTTHSLRYLSIRIRSVWFRPHRVTGTQMMTDTSLCALIIQAAMHRLSIILRMGSHNIAWLDFTAAIYGPRATPMDESCGASQSCGHGSWVTRNSFYMGQFFAAPYAVLVALFLPALLHVNCNRLYHTMLYLYILQLLARQQRFSCSYLKEVLLCVRK